MPELPIEAWSGHRWVNEIKNGTAYLHPPGAMPKGRVRECARAVRECMPDDSPHAKAWRRLAAQYRNDSEEVDASPIGALSNVYFLKNRYIMETVIDNETYYTTGGLAETKASLSVMGLEDGPASAILHKARTHRILAGAFALCGYAEGIHTDHQECGDISIYNPRGSSLATEPLPGGWLPEHEKK